MKILKIFGLVVGIHVLAFMFVFAIPGCRSMSRHSPPPPAAVQAERTPVRTEAAYPQSDAPTPVVSSPSPAAVEPALNPGTTSPSPAVSFSLNGGPLGGVRANPTRPGTATAARLAPTTPMDTPPVANYVVVAGDSLSKIAKKHNLSSRELAAANNLRPEAPLRLGQKLQIPGKATPVSTTATPPAGQTGETLAYKVRPGDSLALIAKRAGTTTAAIRSLNHLKNDTVRAGQELTLPAGSTAAATLASSPAEPDNFAVAPRAADGAVHHIVKNGESLGIIARHYGVKSSEIAVANNIADPLKVRAGQDLVIPMKMGGSARGTTAQRPLPQPPMVEDTPAAAPPSTPISPIDASPIAPSTAMPPPTVEVQESNPIATPKP